MTITNVGGDITTLDKSIPIVHQCNLTSTRGAGLAYIIHKKFPYSNIYQKRRIVDQSENTGSKYGTIVVSEPTDDQPGPVVVSLLSQYEPGGPEEEGPDSPLTRLGAFVLSLKYLSEWVTDHTVKKIAFPYLIGCGLAGGNWNLYLGCIGDFDRRHSDLETLIVHLPLSKSRSLDSDSDSDSGLD